MIKSLRLENFKRHENLYQEFEGGMVVIRGGNEQGKSSILHGIAYCLFGVKVLPTSLDDTVTWGKPVNTLKATLVVTCEGTDYTITRSKSGAEITYNDQRVTGQTETSNFVEKLFGVSSNNAASLMVASQGSIRGALASGPKATVEIIESLANFDLIDQVVELVQTNLVTGPTASAEAVLQNADLRLELARAEVITPDTQGWEETAVGFDKKALEFTAKAELIAPDMLEVKEHMLAAQAESATVKTLQNKLVMFKDSIVSREASIVALTETVNERPDTEVIIKLQKELEGVRDVQALILEHKDMVAMMDYFPESFWEGTEASLDAAIVKSKHLIDQSTISMAAFRADIRLFESQKVSGSVCGFCNQDVSKFPEVAKKNAELEKNIALGDQSVASLSSLIADENLSLKVMQDIKSQQSKYTSKVSANVKGHDTQVPMSLSWIGEVPVALDEAALYSKQAELTRLRAELSAAEAAAAKLSAERELIAEYQAKIVEVETSIASFSLASRLEELTVEYNGLFESHAECVNEAAEADFQSKGIRGSIEREAIAYKVMLESVETAELDVRLAKKVVDDLVFNNALIKRLRAARPIIADRLWNVVLGAVSSYFSTMRGFTSCVTKSSDGFKVGGQSVEGLSGSTLDILGLAIRLALTRTFLPSAPFLILDEPSAAMDDKRSQDMVGFLLAFGFAQTLMVTHKEINEGAANQLITL
jgi:DNA repair exonuclease SbcCD ATPase subunit